MPQKQIAALCQMLYECGDSRMVVPGYRSGFVLELGQVLLENPQNERTSYCKNNESTYMVKSYGR